MKIPKHPTLLRRMRDARVKELQARCPPLAASLGRQLGGAAGQRVVGHREHDHAGLAEPRRHRPDGEADAGRHRPLAPPVHAQERDAGAPQRHREPETRAPGAHDAHRRHGRKRDRAGLGARPARRPAAGAATRRH